MRIYFFVTISLLYKQIYTPPPTQTHTHTHTHRHRHTVLHRLDFTHSRLQTRLTHRHVRTHSPSFKHFKVEPSEHLPGHIQLHHNNNRFKAVFVVHRKQRKLFKHHLLDSSLNLSISPSGAIKSSEIVYWEMMAWIWKTAQSEMKIPISDQ